MTTIEDTIAYANGQPVNGEVVVYWDPFLVGNVAVAGGSERYEIIDGLLHLQLVANAAAQPHGTYYTAKFELESGRAYEETWIVPMLDQVNLGQIRIGFPATPSSMINIVQLSGGGAEPGMFLQWDGLHWVTDYPSAANISPNYIRLLASGAPGPDTSWIDGNPVGLGGTATLNIPDAGVSSRGVVTTVAQTFAGVKTFEGLVTGTLTVTGAGSGVIIPGMQTPWRSDIDGGGFDLANVDSIFCTNVLAQGNMGVRNAASGNYLYWSASANHGYLKADSAFTGNFLDVDMISGAVAFGALVESKAGGYKFPDATIQTTAALPAATAQTPWLTNINAANFRLDNAGQIYTASYNVTAGFAGAGLVIKEAANAGWMAGDIQYAPRLGFAWSGGNWAQIGISETELNTIRTFNGAGTAYGGFQAAQIESKSGGYKFPDATVQLTALTKAGAQTPWTQSVDAAGFDLMNVTRLDITGASPSLHPTFNLEVLGKTAIRESSGQLLLEGTDPVNQFLLSLQESAQKVELLAIHQGVALLPLIITSGNVGLGASSPAYKLDVAGVVNSSTGGYRFPDGTVQLSAASVGAAAQTPWLSNIDAAGFYLDYAVYLSAKTPGKGSVQLVASDSAATTGYVQWLKGDSTRLGYMGAGATSLVLGLENGASFYIAGGIVHAATGGYRFPDDTLQTTAALTKAAYQTPWTQDVSAAGFNLVSVNNVIAKIFNAINPAGAIAGLQIFTDSNLRWIVGKNDSAETGSNAGSDFVIYGYSDTSAFLHAPFVISRASGTVSIGKGLDCYGALNVFAGGINCDAVGYRFPDETVQTTAALTKAAYQTPWTQQIDGASHSLVGAGTVHAAGGDIPLASWQGSAVEIREHYRGGAQAGDMKYAPRITFHWSEWAAAQVGLDTTGTIRTFDASGTGYAPFAASGIEAAGVTSVSGNLGAGIRVREVNRGGATGIWANAPRIAFHWTGAAGSQIGVGAHNVVRTFHWDNDTYAGFEAALIESKASGFKFPDGTVQTTASTSGGAAAQTPWVTNIDAAGFSLTGAQSLISKYFQLAHNGTPTPTFSAYITSVGDNLIVGAEEAPNAVLWLQAWGYMKFLTGNPLTERLRVTDTAVQSQVPFTTLVLGNRFGTSSGAAAGVGTNPAGAGILLYSHSNNNWAGMGADNNGVMWFRTGIEADVGAVPTVVITPGPNFRVGIGTVAPAYKLHVSGDVNTTGVYRINGVAVATGAAAQTPWLSNINGAGFTLTDATVNLAGGMLLQAGAIRQQGSHFIDTGVSGVGDLTIRMGSGYTTAITVLNNCNVGIGGMAGPQAKLHVLGPQGLPDGIYGSGCFSGGDLAHQVRIGYSTSYDAGWIQAVIDSVGARPLLLQPMGGHVGIGNPGTPPWANAGYNHLVVGSTVPSSSMGCITIAGNGADVWPSLIFANYANAGTKGIAQIWAACDGAANSGFLDFFTLNAGAAGDAKMRILANGNIGIGTVSPTHRLAVAGGNISVHGGGGWSIYTGEPNDTNWRFGMHSATATVGFNRSLATNHVQYVSFAGNPGQGFAVGDGGTQLSAFEVTGSGNSYMAYFRGDVGIKTTPTASYALAVAGGIYANNFYTPNGTIVGVDSVEVHQQGNGDRYAYVDLHSYGVPYANDYSARMLRAPGANGEFQFIQTGSGTMYMNAGGGGNIELRTYGPAPVPGAYRRLWIDPASTTCVASPTIGTGFGNCSLQLREAQEAGGAGGNMAYSPGIAFHWSALRASQIRLAPDGELRVLDNPGTSYEKFRCLQLAVEGGTVWASHVSGGNSFDFINNTAAGRGMYIAHQGSGNALEVHTSNNGVGWLSALRIQKDANVAISAGHLYFENNFGIYNAAHFNGCAIAANVTTPGANQIVRVSSDALCYLPWCVLPAPDLGSTPLSAGKIYVGNTTDNLARYVTPANFAAATQEVLRDITGEGLFQNGWVNFGGGFHGGNYHKSIDGYITVRGMITGGAIAANTVLFNLPAGYRPTAILLFNLQTSGGVARIDVMPDGNVRLGAAIANNGWLSLTGICFTTI